VAIELAEFLAAEAFVLASTILVGFSLGAHVAGYTGHHLNGTIGSIYGLDPAGPLFKNSKNHRLHYKDAQFVQVIKTSNWLGNTKVEGHQNFYPNGGLSQPGCKFIVETLTPTICSHHMAHEFFRLSLVPEKAPLTMACSPVETESDFSNAGAKVRFGFPADQR
jgi:hypothetical protein